jgi:hypothetical protein
MSFLPSQAVFANTVDRADFLEGFRILGAKRPVELLITTHVQHWPEENGRVALLFPESVAGMKLELLLAIAMKQQRAALLEPARCCFTASGSQSRWFS